jgi:cysteine-rich repeat protein
MYVVKGIALIALALTACVAPNHVACGDGRYCPANTVCAAVTDPALELCIPEDEVAICADAPRYRRCQTDQVQDGRCYDGVCLAIACGNGRLDLGDPNVPGDLGELCDDGDQDSGDGCSADCSSTETCGNGLVDIAKGEACDDGNHVDNDGCDSVCQNETVGWVGVTEAEPYVGIRVDYYPLYEGHREQFAMAYDGAHNQTVLFGGLSRVAQVQHAILNDTWVFDGAGWLEIKTDVAPVARTGHAMAYDAKRRRVVLFGGFSDAGVALNDTWEWDGLRWSAIVTPLVPGARANHAMAFDSKRGVVVMYGGDKNTIGSSGASFGDQWADTWLWDGKDWKQQDTPTTFPRCSGLYVGPNNGRGKSAFAFDPVRGAAILWGGRCSAKRPTGQVYQYAADTDVWQLDGGGWTSKSPSSGPPAPTLATTAQFAFSPQSTHMLLFTVSPLEQWEWDGAAWTQFTDTLPQHEGFALATDFERQRIVMHGGYGFYDDVVEMAYVDKRYTHEWNGSAWVQVDTTAPPAPALSTYDTRRGRAIALSSQGLLYERAATGWTAGTTLTARARAIAYDSARGKTVVYAVSLADSTVTETWTWDGSTWQQVSGTQPPAVTSPAMAFDSKRKQVVWFGGEGTSFIDETWLFDGVSWTQAAPAQRPPGRFGHSLAYDVHGDRTVLFGGINQAVLQDTWLWDGTTWTQATPAHVPSARASAGLVLSPKRERLVLVGGWNTDDIGQSDVWEWSGSDWLIQAPPTILGRGGAVVTPTHDGSALSVTGGYARRPIVGLYQPVLVDGGLLRWQGDGANDICADAVDFEDDQLAGCADLDGAFTCTPLCLPSEQTTCGMEAPRCGDASCASGVEDCRSCPGDCGACTAICGDWYCDPGETAASCPGDC